jgi:lipopolysaccharide transport system permease protein
VSELASEARVPLPVLELDGRPAKTRKLLSEFWSHRGVLFALARSDFHARYKRASFGVLWSVAVPLIQAAVLAVVFSRVIRVGTGDDFGAYVMSGVLPWSYFSITLGAGSTSIVDGSGLTDKVWFPRALLPISPALANVVALGVSLLAIVVATPLLGGDLSPRILLLVPAAALLMAFTIALALVAAALHVYFRDVRFLIQAALLMWFYVTPIFYPIKAVGKLKPFINANPMTGIIGLFHLATVGATDWQGPLLVSVGVTVVLVAIAIETYRRHDRLFADLL